MLSIETAILALNVFITVIVWIPMITMMIILITSHGHIFLYQKATMRRESIRMTNREWLRSLTDNELAEIFCDNDLGNICNICVYRNDRKGCMNVMCCEYGVSEWLKQEHKDDE